MLTKVLAPVMVVEMLLLAQVAATPDWLQAVRELGSFGLVAFVVWWYATHVAPRAQSEFLEHNRTQRKESADAMARLTDSYLDSLKASRQDYLDSAKAQRADYLQARSEDRTQLNSMITAVSELAEATNKHVAQAAIVWRKQGVTPGE